jgi:hypothetical protein
MQNYLKLNPILRNMDKLSRFLEVLCFALLIGIIGINNVTAQNSVRVGIVIDLGNDVFKWCMDVPEGLSAYEILQKTGLNITWSKFASWGYGLCGIENVGCSSSNCFCNSSYWNFYIAKFGESDWKYSPVGFSGGLLTSDCWNGDYSSSAGHFCAEDGYMIGLAYGGYGTKPQFYSFEELCGIPTHPPNVQAPTGYTILNPSTIIGISGLSILIILIAGLLAYKRLSKPERIYSKQNTEEVD